MKRNLTLGLLLLAVHFLNANPLPSPNNFVLSELFFNTEGKWEIELKFFDESFYFYGTENIHIYSKSGYTSLKHINKDPNSDKLIIKITSDSLQSNLLIDPLGDSIFIINDFAAYPLISPLVYGNCVTSSVRAPKTGESIALYGFDYAFDYDFNYSIDKSPTIGNENDSTGMCGTIKGKILDPYNLLPDNVWLAGNGIIDFKPEANGNYSARITSSKHDIEELYYFATRSEISMGYYVKILPVPITTELDTVVNIDLHIYDIVSSIESIKKNQESIFKILPNPIKDYSFNYEIAIPVKSANSYIEIINMNGQSVGQFSIYESSGRINLQKKLQNGTYTIRLCVNNKNYANSKIIVAN